MAGLSTPGDMIGELYRVLQPGGHMVVTVPFVWDEHEIPYGFTRYTSFGLKHVLQQKGFVVVAEKKTTNYVATVCQMWAAYVYQHILPQQKVIRIALTPLLIAPITVCGLLSAAILPKNMNFFHNNVMVVQKEAKSDI